jgi:hypothetical protein
MIELGEEKMPSGSTLGIGLEPLHTVRVGHDATGMKKADVGEGEGRLITP